MPCEDVSNVTLVSTYTNSPISNTIINGYGITYRKSVFENTEYDSQVRFHCLSSINQIEYTCKKIQLGDYKEEIVGQMRLNKQSQRYGHKTALSLFMSSNEEEPS